MASRAANYSEAQFKKDLKELSNLLTEYTNANKSAQDDMEGGAVFDLRSFTVHEVDGKPYNGPHIRVELNSKYRSSGEVRQLKKPQKPLKAARRIFKSLCANEGKKVGCKKTFTMIETTQGSKKKVYGPYYGEVKPAKSKPYKVTPADGGKAITIAPKNTYSVKLVKEKKGGAKSSKMANFFSN